MSDPVAVTEASTPVVEKHAAPEVDESGDRKAKKPCTSALGFLKKYSEIVADTADYNALPADAVDATTNPTLITKVAADAGDDTLIQEAIKLTKDSGDFQVTKAMHYLSALVAKNILAKIPGLVSLEINPKHSFNKAEMLSDANELLDICKKTGVDVDRVVVKVPATWDGVGVCKSLADKGIKVNMTLVFSVVQAIACVDAGAFLISPFVGRISDYYVGKPVNDRPCGEDQDAGVEMVRRIYATIKKSRPESKTIVMAASFRSTKQVLDVCGCSKITISPKLINDLSDQQGQELKDENEKLPVELSMESAEDWPRDPIAYDKFNFLMSTLLMPQVLISDGVKKFHVSWNETEAFLVEKAA